MLATDDHIRPEPEAAEPPGAHHVLRPGWLAVAAGLLALAVIDARSGNASWWLLAGFLVLPDLSFLAAIGATGDLGQQLPRRAVFAYNALHRLVGPGMVLIGVAAGVLPRAGVVAALGWATHIALDRGVGYGLRDREGRQRG